MAEEKRGRGRPKGGANMKTRAIMDKAMKLGITPGEVMLGAMRDLWEQGDKIGAAAIAKDAAPYCHPRLQSVEVDAEVRSTIESMSDDALRDRALRFFRKAGIIGDLGGIGIPSDDEPDQGLQTLQ